MFCCCCRASWLVVVVLVLLRCCGICPSGGKGSRDVSCAVVRFGGVISLGFWGRLWVWVMLGLGVGWAEVGVEDIDGSDSVCWDVRLVGGRDWSVEVDSRLAEGGTCIVVVTSVRLELRFPLLFGCKECVVCGVVLWLRFSWSEDCVVDSFWSDVSCCEGFGMGCCGVGCKLSIVTD